MTRYDRTWLMGAVANHRIAAARRGVFDGTQRTYGYLERCRAFHEPTGTLLIFTRDSGAHESGWYKNPEYDRCLHLSLSFWEPAGLITGPGAAAGPQIRQRDVKLTREWIGLFFGDDRRKLWCEPPYSDAGRARETWHYRLFTAPNWTPIHPRGEVYTRRFTEAGWKSWSDVRAELGEAQERAKERAS